VAADLLTVAAGAGLISGLVACPAVGDGQRLVEQRHRGPAGPDRGLAAVPEAEIGYRGM